LVDLMALVKDLRMVATMAEKKVDHSERDWAAS
jgi:hypothetical protein